MARMALARTLHPELGMISLACLGKWARDLTLTSQPPDFIFLLGYGLSPARSDYFQ